MARISRIVVPCYPHHVIQRGNRRQRVFFSEDDKIEYLRLIEKHSKLEDVKIWAYCLMDNHVHFVAEPATEKGIASCFAAAHKRYSRGINFCKGWRGYLWQGRFISYLMDEPHTCMAIRYIEQNPVRAGIVGKAHDYKWSSAKAHVYKQIDPILSTPEWIYKMAGDWEKYLELTNKDEMVRLLKKHARTGRPVGGEGFIKQLETLTGRCLRKQKPGPKTIK